MAQTRLEFLEAIFQAMVVNSRYPILAGQPMPMSMYNEMKDSMERLANPIYTLLESYVLDPTMLEPSYQVRGDFDDILPGYLADKIDDETIKLNLNNYKLYVDIIPLATNIKVGGVQVGAQPFLYMQGNDLMFNAETSPLLVGGNNMAPTSRAVKVYVDSAIQAVSGGGVGNMLKSTYDTDENGVVDDSERLGSQLPNYYLVWDNITGKPSAYEPLSHQLDSSTYHTVSGLTVGYFLKSLSTTTFGFAFHGLGYLDVGAEEALGNPTVDGRLLSSTIAGIRSWVPPYELPSTINVDTINEYTLDYGVEIEGMLLRDESIGFGARIVSGGGTQYGIITYHETLPYNSITNLVVGGRIDDATVIINYTAKRGSLYQQGEIILLNKMSAIEISHIWDADDIGLTVTGDILGNDLRLNMNVDNSSANDIIFSYVGETVGLGQILSTVQIWKDLGGNLSFTDEVTGTKTLAELAFTTTQYWQKNGIVLSPFTLGDNIATSGKILVDIIEEYTLDYGVEIEGIFHKDNYISFPDALDIREDSTKIIFYSSINRVIRIAESAGNDSITGLDNILIGYLAGNNITSGSSNIIIGAESFINISEGSRNVVIGYNTLRSSNNVSDSVIIGYAAGMDANYGTIVYIGYAAGHHIVGANNVFIGYAAGFGVETTSTGAANIGIGTSALYAITTGNNNLGIGVNSLVSLNSGEGNIAIGNNSLRSLIDGEYSVAIGVDAGYYSIGEYNVFVGYGAGTGIVSASITGDLNVLIGYSAGWYHSTGTSNTVVGAFSMAGSDSYTITGAGNVAIGSEAGRYNSSGYYNVYIGGGAGKGTNLSNNALSNVGIGFQSLYNISTGHSNVAVGYQAGHKITTSVSLTAIGYCSGYYATGEINTFLGAQAGFGIDGQSTGSYNLFIGYTAGHNFTTGSFNLLIGNYVTLYSANVNYQFRLGINDRYLLEGNMELYSEWVGTDYIFKTNLINEFTVGDGITFGHRVITPASTTSYAGLRLPHGAAPASPVNGDIWTTTTSAYARINGSTIDLGVGGGTVYTFRYSLVESSNYVNFVNDADAPGNSKLYGTNSSGIKGWYDIPTAGTPDAHATSHQDGGSDEISVVGLGGLLGDAQTALPHVLDSSFHTISGKTAGQILLATAATTYGFTTVSGDITINGSGVVAIGTNKVTLVKMAQVATASFLGRITVGFGDVEALNATQATSLLNLFSTTSNLKGLVPGSSNLGVTYFLRADGNWAVPAGGGGTTPVDSTLLDWVTDRYQAYGSKQSGGEFYTGTTDTTATTRLNYNGYFYASRLYTNNIYTPVASPDMTIMSGADGSIVLGTISGNQGIYLGNANASVIIAGILNPVNLLSDGWISWAAINGQVYGSMGYSGHPIGYNLTVRGGTGYGIGNNDGGNLYLYGGSPNGSGIRGNIYFGNGSAGYLPAKTTETYIVYYNPSTGKLSYGTP